MKNNFIISISSGNVKSILTYQLRTFPAGEIYIRLDNTDLKKLNYISINNIVIKGDIKTSDNIMELLLLKDALDNELYNYNINYTLILPYLPYGRQDRVCRRGESFSIKIMTNLINSMKFDKVINYDNHSEISTNLINNGENVTILELLGSNKENIIKNIGIDFDLLCAPDSGSKEKVLQISEIIEKHMIQINKSRDNKGKIIDTQIIEGENNMIGKSILIIDDICDGGATLIAVTNLLKEKGAKKVSIFVTHGIFSKGISHLLNNNIDNIITTDSYYKDEGEIECIKVIKLEKKTNY